MLTASILARRGRRVLVLERAAVAGGRLRSYDVDGFVVDCGAFLWPNAFLDEALHAAAVTDFLASEIAAREVMRIYVHDLQGQRFAFPWVGRDAAALGDTVREVYRVTADEFRALGGILEWFTQLDPVEVGALRP